MHQLSTHTLSNSKLKIIILQSIVFSLTGVSILISVRKWNTQYDIDNNDENLV